MGANFVMRGRHPEAMVMNRQDGPSGWHALLVSPDPADRAMLEPMFRGRNWKLRAVESLPAALEFLRNTAVRLVITERDLMLGSWQELLRETQNSSRTSQLVVISRLADDRLWAEVLNLGGHDVLAKPLRESEVLWVCNHLLEPSTGL